jgi:hypothetical protein
MNESKGQYLVGAGFNPSGDEHVAAIKLAAAALIDLIEDIPTGLNAHFDLGLTTEAGQQRARLKALAVTSAEEAAMWAVKAATKGNRT